MFRATTSVALALLSLGLVGGIAATHAHASEDPSKPCGLDLSLFSESQLAERHAAEDRELAKRHKQERDQVSERQEAERKELRRIERERFVADVRAVSRRTDVHGQAFRDALAFEWVQSLGKDGVALLVGNPYEPPQKNQAHAISELVTLLAKKSWVIYDADSMSARIIADAAGERGLGISGNLERAAAQNLKQFVFIDNPYLRMKALTRPKAWIKTPDSVAGVGAELMLQDAYFKVFDPDKNSAANFAKRLFDARQIDVPSDPLSFDGEAYLEKLDEATLSGIMADAAVYAKGVAQMSGLPGGAALFGGATSSVDPTLVRSSVQALASQGIPIATGGSGGFMEVGNKAAFRAGADSIAIPLDSSGLKFERYRPEQFHTMTVVSTGYSTRIPLLLNRRQLILVAPGGKGTAQEVATTFFHLSAHPERSQQVVFFEGADALDLRAQPIGPIHFVQSPEQVVAIARDIEERLGKDVFELRTAQPPSPREKASPTPVVASPSDKVVHMNDGRKRFEVGQEVMHNIFGRGKITGIRGDGAHTVEVKFKGNIGDIYVGDLKPVPGGDVKPAPVGNAGLPQAQSPSNEPVRFSVNQVVSHKKFGRGVVLEVSRKQALVNFAPSIGAKRVMISFLSEAP